MAGEREDEMRHELRGPETPACTDRRMECERKLRLLQFAILVQISSERYRNGTICKEADLSGIYRERTGTRARPPRCS